MNHYRLNTNILRGLIYLVLIFLLIVTVIPIWLLLVNATRSTVQIQQGLSLMPSTHAL